MAASADDDNNLRTSGLNPGRSVSPEIAPAASRGRRLGRRSDRVRKLLDTILTSFRLGFQNLPSEAQQAFTNFQQNQDYREFGITLRHLILEESLDEFINESPAFLYAATPLFDSRYPHLNLKGRLDELEGRKQKGSSKTQSRRSPKSRRRSKKEARRNNEARSAGDISSGPSNARAVRTLTRQKKGKKSKTVTWAKTGPRPQPSSTRIPTINVESAGYASEEGNQPTPTNTSVTPGFVVNTRMGIRNEQAPESNDEELRGRQGRKTALPNSSLEDPEPDFNLYPYKGWKIEQPAVLLHRARNFLADEDIDRTLDWSQKFAELAEYFSYLLHNWQGEDWGADLHEVINMLYTHQLFEQYHYGSPQLNLNFDDVLPKHSNRLLPITGAEVSVENLNEDEVSELGERKLLLTKIRPAIDVHYKLPSKVLSKYIHLYTSDASRFWGFTSAFESPRRGLMDLENAAYEECIYSNMSNTCRRLEAAEAKFKTESDEERFSSGALQAFAALRGTRRAAVQQTLSYLDNAENLAVCNVFRTLILPPPKIPEKPDAGIIIPTMQVANVPVKESQDPFSYTLAHRWYMKADRYWGDWAYEHAVKECYGHKLWENRKEPIMDLPKNFKGPYVHDFLDHDMKKALSLLRRCEILKNRILLQNERTPRDFIKDVIQCLLNGLRGTHWEDTDMEFYDDEFAPGSRRLVHIRPKEEEFLRLLGEHSINRRTVDPSVKGFKVGPHSDLFEQRVKNMFYGEGTTDAPSYGFEEFVKELNRDCDGPVKRWRFSEMEAWEEAYNFQEKGLVKIYEGTVFCAQANLHPEQRIRWLDMDEDLGAFVQTVDPANPKKSEENAEASHENDEIETISTVISVPVSKDFGDYMFGLPKIEHLRSWEELAEVASGTGDDAFEQDVLLTNEFCKNLCFRLGKTIHDIRAMEETYRRQLTPRQRGLNSDFVDFVVHLWDSDARVRPNKDDKNPKKVGDKLITPSYQDIIKMVEPELYKPNWDQCRREHGSLEDLLNRERIRKGIIREAYENKSMIFPSRIDRYTDEESGLMVQLPRRHEPVWSFAHPERKAKGPRYWDMNRWPLHLQSESTAERIRSGAFHKDAPEKPVFSSPVAAPLESHQPPSRPGTQSAVYEDTAASPVAAPPESHQPPRRPETQPAVYEDTAALPVSAKETDTSEHNIQTIPGLGEEFVVTYEDVANSRRTFTPGPPHYFLGDTPLQKKYIENFVKGGIESVEPSTWRQRLGALFGRRNVQDDPMALPEVDPRDIPKSRPRCESSDDETSEREMPDVMDNDEIDVEMEELATQQPYDESEALETASPMVPPSTRSLPVEQSSLDKDGHNTALMSGGLGESAGVSRQDVSHLAEQERGRPRHRQRSQ